MWRIRRFCNGSNAMHEHLEKDPDQCFPAAYLGQTLRDGGTSKMTVETHTRQGHAGRLSKIEHSHHTGISLTESERRSDMRVGCLGRKTGSPCFRARRRKDNRRTLIAELPELGSLDRRRSRPLSGSRPGPASPGNPNDRSTQLQLRQLFPFECVLEPIQKELIHEQGLGLVKRLSMRRIMARRTKAPTVVVWCLKSRIRRRLSSVGVYETDWAG